MEGPLLRQAPRNAHAVDAVHPGEPLRHRPGLVRLQRSDEMPAHGEALELVHLAQGLFHIVFAEIRDAQRGGLPHIFGSLVLRNRDQSHGGGVAPRRLGSVGDLSADAAHRNRQILRAN